MGARNRDRILISELRGRHETVAQMLAARWDVISKCPACGLVMAVDLDLIAWRTGAKTSLWNRRPRCRRVGCQGRVEFQARLPGVGFYQTLNAPWPHDGKP